MAYDHIGAVGGVLGDARIVVLFGVVAAGREDPTIMIGADVLVCLPGALLLGGALADDVGRVVAFEAGSFELFEAPTSRAMCGVVEERGWQTGHQRQRFRGQEGGWSTWRGTHLPFSVPRLSLMCFGS